MTENEFCNAIKELGINYNDEQLNKLNIYYQMLTDYNKITNLTRIVDKNQVYLKHFYDSLTIVKSINLNNCSSLCDIGTGAGFPGIVLKIFFPHLNVTLVDSLGKRIYFLKLVIKILELNNITAIHSRIEDYARIKRECFDIVTARAVANINMLLELAIPLLKRDRYFVAMKGLEENSSTFQNALFKLNSRLENVISFNLPFEHSNRNIYLFKKIKLTSLKYPRKFKEIKVNPL